MADRCVPGPIESCSMVWSTTGEGAQARMQAHARLHANGGIEEICPTAADTNGGLAINPVGERVVQEITGGGTESNIRFTADGQVWVRRQPKKKRIFSAVVNAGTPAGETFLLDTTLQIDATAHTADTCWEVCLDINRAFLNFPQGLAPVVSVPDATVAFSAETHLMPQDTHVVSEDRHEMPFDFHEVPTVTITYGTDGGTSTHDHGGQHVHDHGGAHIHNHGGDHSHDHGGDYTHDHGGDQIHNHGGTLSVVEEVANAEMLVTIGTEEFGIFAADRFSNVYSGRICIDELILAGGVVHDVPLKVRVVANATVTGFPASTGKITALWEQTECPEVC